jgi:glycosyltransferase involved in cell wall biosynthesis
MNTDTKSTKMTVITVCFNSEKYIEGAIRSVLSQSYPDLEYIVIDGASTDSTLPILDRYKARIAKIVSEKDDGIYDAMNKGVRLATGDIIYFLNADDRFFDRNVAATIVDVFATHVSPDLVIGTLELANRSIWDLYNMPTFRQKPAKKLQLIIDGFCHQRIFAKRSLFERVGLFNLEYPYAADLDWVLRAFDQKAKFLFIENPVAYYDVTGFSSRWLGAIPDIISVVFKNSNLFEFMLYFIYISLRKINRMATVFLKRMFRHINK